MAGFGLYEDDGSMRVSLSGGAGVAGGQIQGNIGDAAADTTTNPVKVGGIFLTSPPTYTNTQRTTLQTDSRGSLKVSLMGPSSTNAVAVNTNADALANSISVNANALQYVYNGTTWDRMRDPYLLSQTPITASSGNVANASAAATLAGTASKTTYITGFQITASGSTGALVVTATVTGTITGTMSYTFVFPAGVTVPATPLIVTFAKPVPASATNTSIVVTLPAGGAGNTNATVSAQGFQQA